MSKLICRKILITILIGLILQLQDSNGASFGFKMETIKEIESLRDNIVEKLLRINQKSNSNGLNLLNFKSDGEKHHSNGNFMSLNVLSPEAAALPGYQNPTSRPFTAVFIPDGYTQFKLDLPADFYSGEYFTIV